MMKIAWTRWAGWLVFGACMLSISPAQAEVAARTDSYGQYRAIQLAPLIMDGQPLVWAPHQRNSRMASRRVHPLNPEGDRLGDLAPTVAELPMVPFHPVAVWSRENVATGEYDLVWSRWTMNGWLDIEWVEDKSTPGSDLDPVIVFDDHNRLVMAWWNELEGQGSVQASMLTWRGWSPPVTVSPEGVDARQPVLSIVQGGVLNVEYTTPEGQVEQLVSVDDPGTITDDINPIFLFEIKQWPGDQRISGHSKQRRY